jgi:hypothetical protein
LLFNAGSITSFRTRDVDFRFFTLDTGRFSASQRTVETGHERAHAPQRTACLFDHLVREEGPWQLEAECLGGLHIDDEFELGRCLNRKVGCLLAF